MRRRIFGTVFRAAAVMVAGTGLTVTMSVAAPADATAGAAVPVRAAAPRVTATELLPPPGSAPGTRTAAFDLNNEGQVVGASYEQSLDILGTRPVLWNDGRATELPAPEGDESYRAEHINDRGDVLVETTFGGAYRWFDGEVTDLRGTDDEWVTTVDLNESGQAIITRSPRAGVYTADTYGLWDAGTFGRLLPEGQGAGSYMWSIELSDAGMVAGTLTSGGLPVPTPTRAFAWQGGTFRVVSEGWYSRAVGVNRHGQIVGQISDAEGGTLWDVDGRAIGLPIQPRDINDRGQVAGSLYRGDQRIAAVWEDGRLTTLGSLGGSYTEVTAINERGQVVGVSETPDGEDHYFFWTGGHMLDLGLTGPQLSTTPPLRLNDEGQAIGQIETADGPRQMLWTVDDGSEDSGGGGCFSATNAAHVRAGRARSVAGFAWALGSGQFLGLTSHTTALRQAASGHWERATSC